MYSRYGHVNQIFVKVGDRVKAGQKIATNGTGNGQWLAHLHRDHPIEIPNGNYGFYNIGWTKEKTIASFADPTKYPKALGDGYSHPGYEWMEYASYATGKCYHPGLDENGKGSGNDDYDDPVYAVADGVVEYVYDGAGGNGGWGHLIVIKELNENVMTDKLKKAIKALGFDFGDNLNDSESDKLGERILSVVGDLEACKNAAPQVVEKVIEKTVEVPVYPEMSAIDHIRKGIQMFLGIK